jgi:hypothetical protein
MTMGGPAPEGEEIERVRRICMALPEATEKPFGGHDPPAFRVREKIFANIQTGDGRISLVLKGAPGAQDVFVTGDPKRFFVPPYSGHKGWIGVRLDAPPIDWGIVEELLIDSYRIIAPKRLAKMAETR